MAFDASVVVLECPYGPDIEGIYPSILGRALGAHGLTIERTVDKQEYAKNTRSREINKYIRVPKKVLEKQAAEGSELIKVGTGCYEYFAQFSNSRYGFTSISSLDDHRTVIWNSFHAKLYYAFAAFHNIPFLVASLASSALGVPAMVLHTSTFSRSSDVFAFYVNGEIRSEESGKTALTNVKNTYGVDINDAMLAVDENAAIFYAIDDYALLSKEVAKVTAIRDDWKRKAEDIALNIEVKSVDDAGNETIEHAEALIKENERILTTLNLQLQNAAKLVTMNPKGNMTFFLMSKMKDVDKSDEQLFGANVRSLHGRSAAGSGKGSPSA